MIERRVQRVAEVDVPIASDHDIVRRVEALALKPVGNHFNLSIPVGAGDSPRTIFTGIEASLAIHGVAVGPVGSLAIYLRALARNVFVNAVLVVIAEQQ